MSSLKKGNIKVAKASFTDDNRPTVETVKEKASTLISANVVVNGKRTSIRLEQEMWTAFNEIARREKFSIHELCSMVAQIKEKNQPLTSTIRIFIMGYFKSAATLEGHEAAGHGKGLFLYEKT